MMTYFYIALHEPGWKRREPAWPARLLLRRGDGAAPGERTPVSGCCAGG